MGCAQLVKSAECVVLSGDGHTVSLQAVKNTQLSCFVLTNIYIAVLHITFSSLLPAITDIHARGKLIFQPEPNLAPGKRSPRPVSALPTTGWSQASNTLQRV